MVQYEVDEDRRLTTTQKAAKATGVALLHLQHDLLP